MGAALLGADGSGGADDRQLGLRRLRLVAERKAEVHMAKELGCSIGLPSHLLSLRLGQLEVRVARDRLAQMRLQLRERRLRVALLNE